MTEVDRHGSDRDLTYDLSQPGKFIPIEKVDRLKYDIIHPENAMSRLGMSARTAYRKVDAGELEYTLEKGSKRILVRKDQSLSDRPISHVSQISDFGRTMTDGPSEKSVGFQTSDRLLEILPDYQQMLTDRDQEIKTLREEISRIRDDYQRRIDALKAELEQERVSNARIEGELKNIERVVDGKEQALTSQTETISSQKTTIEALNNERIVITQQLQKYRSSDEPKNTESTKNPSWMFWKR